MILEKRSEIIMCTVIKEFITKDLYLFILSTILSIELIVLLILALLNKPLMNAFINNWQFIIFSLLLAIIYINLFDKLLYWLYNTIKTKRKLDFRGET
jgi:cbb3-type cytochrome oxidase subunit 1